MEEDGGVKAPVTRLRRRLSVEQPDDVKSPSAPSTPTKKRSMRLAAKPQLDNIDENAPVSSPARVTRRRSTAKDLIDPTEEKLMTPTQRVAARVTSEVIQSLDSPRAKRALRRNSFVGSDTEGPTTPARQTRRTRKDSDSSVENLAETVTKPNKRVLEETISEEPESIKSSSPRKSLNENVKTSKQDNTTEQKNKKSSPNVSATEGDSPDSHRKSTRIGAKQGDTSLNKSGSEMNTSTSQNKKRLSNSKTNVLVESKQDEIKELDEKSKENPNSKIPVLKSERQRTRSWAPASEFDVSDKTDKTFTNRSFSKKQILSNSVGAGDTIVFEPSVKRTDKADISSDEKENINNSLNSSGKKKGIKNKSFESDKDNIAYLNSSLTKTSDEAEQINGIDTVDYLRTQHSEVNRSAEVLATEKFLQQTDGKSVKCALFVEDTDYNADDANKPLPASSVQTLEGDDQCVPVVNDINDPAPEADQNTSVEPMDVDVTLPENVVIPNLNISKKNKSINQSDSHEKSQMNVSLNKSTVTKAVQDLEKTANENKSTVILSQIKDDSAVDTNVSKSSNKDPSSPSNTSLIAKGKESKNNSLVNEETPLKNKNIKKLGIQTSTPVIGSNETQKMEQSYSKNTSDISVRSKKSEPSESSSSEDESSEDENSKSKSAWLDGEAEDAGDDYESGDSQDASERAYEEENEIIEKGENLGSSDEDVSEDSEYEKDSFVISSDEEDEELLSGSGDDLSLSANELTMSAKSKKKYNEKKDKEQKKASKEIFEARHQKDADEAPKGEKKKNRMRLESAKISSADESLIKTKKNNKRLRIDSSQDSNLEKSFNENCNSKQKKRKLNTSGDIANEHEITAVVNDSIIKKTDPLETAVKMEPKTPQTLEISTVNVSARYEMLEVDANDMTVMRANETTDPLQSTIACDDDSSSLSENEEIKQNYESILNQLNNSKKKQKEDDSSLNMNKKSKSVRELIKDQLNLKHTKNTKKTRKESLSANEKNSEVEGPELDENSSSDLQLLFLEDGDESDHDKKKSKKSHIEEEKDDFIPLKKIEGKTDLRTSFCATAQTESKQTPGSNKKNRNMFLEPGNTDEINSTTTTELPEKGDMNISLNNKNNKNKKLSLSERLSEPVQALELAQVATPGSSKKKNNRQSVSEVTTELSQVAASGSSKKKNRQSVYENTEDIIADSSQVATPGSGKKKKNRQSVSEDTEEVTGELSQVATPGSGKKKKNMQSVSEDTEEVTGELSQVATPGSGKKKKNRQSVSEDIEEVTTELSQVAAAGSSKKKKNMQSVFEDELPQVEIPGSSKKTKTKSMSADFGELMKAELKQLGSPGSNKKKNNKISVSEDLDEVTAELPQILTPAINKKTKNKLTMPEVTDSLDVEEVENLDAASASEPKGSASKKTTRKLESSAVVKTDSPAKNSINELMRSHKKNNSKLSQSLSTEIADVATVNPQSDLNSKKRKRSSETEEITAFDVKESKPRRNNKRARYEDDGTMVPKQSVFSNIQISWLPTTVLDQLYAKPKNCHKAQTAKAPKIVSTSAFTVEETTKRKNKPSQYLEESVNLSSNSPEKNKRRKLIDKPKVLPFLPTVATSGSGFTTNFQVNVLAKETKFVAQLSDLPNFKTSHLQGKNIKKMGTYELYKRHRNLKISKF